MLAINPDWRRALVPVFLTAQILAIHAMASGEHPPPPPALARFPASFGEWRLLHQDPTDPAIGRELGADRLVSQTYVKAPTGSVASLLLAWFQTQRGGVRQPHSPKVCLPGAGWTPRIADEVTVGTALGAITVNRYIVAKGEQRAVVLYWYQTPRRVIAGEWAAKFWLPIDALRDKRTDTALIRVIAGSVTGGDEAATVVATEFTAALYPRLREYLPR